MAERNLAALGLVRWAALVAAPGAAFGSVTSVLSLLGGYLSVTVPSAGALAMFNTTGLYLLLAAGLFGLASMIVSLEFYREAFEEIRNEDERYARSPAFARLAIIGAIFIAVGGVVLVSVVLSLVSCAGAATTIPAACVDLGSLFGVLSLIFLGAILFLGGYIGTLVAIWRLGDRYGDSTFKIGAVFTIFPLLNIVGNVLILVATGRAETAFRQSPNPTPTPSIYSPPPPQG